MMTSQQSHVVPLLILILASNFQSTLSQVVGNTPDCLHELSYGSDPSVERPNVDNARSWTIVMDAEFPQHGLLTSVRFFAKATNRLLEIGIYRPQGRQCEYKLIKKCRFDKSKIQAGYNELSIPNDEWMVVQPGDHYGFSWLSKGVVAFTKTDEDNQMYCDRSGSFSVGQTKRMNRRNENRIYSLSVMYTTYSSSLTLDVGGQGSLSAPNFQTPSPFTYISPVGFKEHAMISGVTLNVQLSLPSTTVKLCTNKARTVSCRSRKTLGIVSAYYAGVEDCTADARSSRCQKLDALDVIREACQGKRSCSVRASSRTMGSLPCAEETKQVVLEVTYACQDASADNLADVGDANFVEGVDIQRISAVNEPSGFTYLRLEPGEICSEDRYRSSSDKTPQECGLECDLDPECEGFEFEPTGRSTKGTCWFVSDCKGISGTSVDVSGYRKSGDLVLAVYKGLDNPPQGSDDRGGKCRLQIQTAAVVKNLASGIQQVTFENAAVEEGSQVGVTFLTSSLHRMRVSAFHQAEFSTSCEREELPYKSWFNYYKGDGSYTYDLKVEYVGSTCKQISGFGVGSDVSILPIIDDDCKDTELHPGTCLKYQQAGNCEKSTEHYMAKRYCQRTCGLCHVTRPTCSPGQIYRPDSNLCEAHCVDSRGNCKNYPARGLCSKRLHIRRCPVSCGACPMSCSRGYTLKNGRCVDINECTKNRGICPANARCVNRQGYYECICRSAYSFAEIHTHLEKGICRERKCVDKKSATYCNRYKKRCFDPKRQAAMLSFCKKTCDLCDVDCNQQGYMINPEKQCVDINECLRKDLFRCGRDAKCNNTDGSYECVCTGDKPLGNPKRRCLAECQEGYRLVGTKCRRINPCTHGLHQCPQNARCQVTKTSYRCRCPLGTTDVVDKATGQHRCIKEMMCRASGDPHFYTFDSTKIDFMGICVYTLISTQCPGHITALPAGFVPFTVDIKNQHRNGKTRVSFLQYIEVEIGEDTVRLDQKGVVWINSQKVQLPYLPEEAVYTIQNEANNVVFRMTSGGLRIVWSGSTTVYVYIDESYGGHVCGLCGNADGDRRNDMMTREGELVKSDAVVGDSWRVPHKGGETCTTVTNESPQCTDAQNQRFAEACGAIAEGAFTACHDKVPPEEIIEECTFDLCAELEGTPEVGVEEAMLTILCSYYQDYADLCIFKGVLVEWNKDGVCPHNPECPAHSMYSHSVTCSPSCADPYGESCLDHPVGGCQCGEDFVQEGMSPMTCVHLEQCGCIHNEIYHSLGETWLNADCSEKYKCVGYRTIEAWGVDCDEEAAVCGDTVPVLNVVQKHGCYCRSQNTNAGITTCDEEIPDTKILIQDPDDEEEEEEEGVIIDEIGTPVVDPFPYPGTPVVDPFPFPGFPQHDEPVVLPVVDPIDDEVIIIDDIVHCQDLLSSDVCETYKANGNCRNMGQLWMSKKYCQNTCGMCDITRPKCNEGEIYRHDTNLCEAHCQDILDDCAAVLDSGKCNTRFGRVRCPITCGVCEPSCSHGYRLEDGKCVDINECDQEDICPANARCANRLGFYICLCLRGYEYSEIYSYTTRQGVCTEQDCADKRSEKHCTTHQERCFDPRLQPIMLRYCKKSCDLCGTQCDKEGYMINQEKECVDIDECSRKDLFRCGRDAKCTNTDGAYKCECTGDKPEGDPKRRCFAECEEGYERRGARCVRINPCTSGLHTCPENAPCQRTRTSYRCRCPKGLTDVIDAETEKHKCIKEFNCVARGDPHYYTFDGVKIDWQGVCPYQLLGTDCPAHIDPLPQDQPHFNLYVKNQHRNGRTRVSFLQYIDAELGDDKVRLDQGGRVYVNSDPVELPYQTLVYEVHFEGNSVVLKSKVNGFKVIWSTTTSVSIYIDEQYQGHVCGICGNADYNETNDMMTKQGELVTSEVMVGDSWRVPGEDGTECEEVTQEVPKCTADDNERFAAECGFITHEPFAACNPVVSPENYMKECMFDLCAETEGHLDTVQLAISVETLCDHYKYYADKCLTEGVLISWEKETLCPNHPQCPENSRYNHNKTCTLSCADPYGWDCLDEHSGGCQCNPGYLQDGDSPMTCVLPHQCGCMDGDKYYSVGKFWYNSDCTEKYKCIGHNNVNIWEIDCNEEAAVCGHTVPVFDVVTNRGCYCRNQPTEGVVQTCDEVITGPTEIVEEPEDDIEIFPPFDPGNDQPFPPFDPGNDQPFPPFDPGNDQPLPSATTESNQPFPPFDPGNDSPVLPFNPGNDQPIPDVDDETETDEPIQSGEPTTYIPVLPQEPVWDYNNGIIPPRLNDSEDNSYFQLQPEPTPQLKPRPLGMESCVIKQSYLSASSEQYGGEAYRARPLSCNSNQPPSGWQPEEEDSDPYLQIDLGTSVPVHGIGTLGHYNKTCWVEKYKVYVSNSDDEDSFVALKDKDTGMDRIFDGNHDQNTWRHYCYHRYYGNPVTARYIRLVPLDQTVCTAMRVELYGFRKSDDPQLIDALQTDAWTKNTSGCQCYFDASRSDCACCEEGGCQCPRSNRHQCVQCGYSANCGIPEQNDDSNQVDPWTKSPDGCPCPENPSDFSCACCQKYSCQCGTLQPNQCVQCGHTEQHCGLKPEVFGPPPVCVPKSCP